VIPRTLFSEEHEIFRDSVRKFFAREIAPHHAAWEEARIVDRSAWLAAGRQGLLCMTVPEVYGGLGLDRLFATVAIEEQIRDNLNGPNFSLHSEVVAPYLNNYGTEAQKQRWLPPMARGEVIGAIAMTEPGAGSDLQALQSRAVRDGDEFVISGQKTFISNGQLADLIIVAAKTNPGEGAKGVTLFLVEADRVGFRRGRNLEKLGAKAQDTSELFFDDVRVPDTNVLGTVGGGFYVLMKELAWERTMLAIRAVAACEAALEWTIPYVRERKVFGKSLLDMQNTRFKLADRKSQTMMARVFVDRCIELVLEGALDASVAAAAKVQTTELLMEVLDDCLQMHGGYGYMWEYPICRAFADYRYMRIAGGSNEVLREIIARTL
jgi:acyl-CoA dehydrogenase